MLWYIKPGDKAGSPFVLATHDSIRRYGIT